MTIRLRDRRSIWTNSQETKAPRTAHWTLHLSASYLLDSQRCLEFLPSQPTSKHFLDCLFGGMSDICSYMRRWAHPCKLVWRPQEGIRPYSLETGSLLGPGASHHGPVDISSLHPPQPALEVCTASAGGMHSHSQLFIWVLGIQTRVLMLACRPSYPLSHHPRLLLPLQPFASM